MEFSVSKKINAAPEKIFKAWTNAEQLKMWSAPGDMIAQKAESDPRVGGRYLLAMKNPAGEIYIAKGEYKEIVENKKLVYTWRWDSWPEETPDSIVSVEFNDNGEQTEITITHSQLPDEQAIERHKQGWEGCFIKLAQYV